MTTYGDPEAIARLIAASPRPLLIGLDCDGVLAPIVAHARDAVLLEGARDAVSAVAGVDSVHVAVVSGRSVSDLERFAFGRDVEVIGSHGMETRNRAMSPLSDAERERLSALHALTVDAVGQAGAGAWIERKPASVVLHVREADAERGARALDALRLEADGVSGATVKAGSGVLELFARSADKGVALVELARRLGAATTVFVGDDVTDEDAFAHLGTGDIAIKVGDADTIAPHRLRDPAAVLALLLALAAD
jgi:trehalose 6-phosphate phosphatase